MQAIMFAARCLGVSLAVFVLLYVTLSVAVSRAWPLLARSVTRLSARRTAGVLFIFRMLPVLAAAAFTLAVTVPSFLLLEPRTSDEEVGAAPLLLGLFCLALMALGIYRAVLAQRKTSQALADWLNGAHQIESTVPVPVFQTGAHAPSLTVAGVCTSRVLVSETTLSILTDRELNTALRHEIAHVRSRDNLKKLIFRFTTFPGMTGLESAWSEASEMAADDAAVSSLSDALDLAAALIKLSRVAPTQASAAFASPLMPTSSASLRARVQRLFSWKSQNAAAHNNTPRYLLPTAMASLVCLVAGYGSLLAGMHAATEWLVR
jgi:Zn-dependent protease with chaperone function